MLFPSVEGGLWYTFAPGNTTKISLVITINVKTKSKRWLIHVWHRNERIVSGCDH